jgi:hypothetical protein
MGKFKRTNKLSLESYLVGGGNQNVATAGTTMVGATSALALANQQLGILSWDLDSVATPLGDFLTAGDDVTDVAAIKIVQGTPNSSQINTVNAFGVGDQAYISTDIIHRDKIRSVSAQRYQVGSYAMEYFSTFNAPLDETEYKMYTELNSVRNDRDFGRTNKEVIPTVFETPDYTVLAATLTQPLDHLLQNLLYKANTTSRIVGPVNPVNQSGNRNLLYLALDSAGAAGTVIGTLVAGVAVPFMTVDGNTFSYVTTTEFINSLNLAIAAGLPAAATIEVIDLSDAGTATAPGINAFLSVGLDEQLAITFDNIEQVRTDIESRLGEGFRVEPLFTRVKVSDPFEGYGSGRMHAIQFNNRARSQNFSLEIHPHGEYPTLASTYIDETLNYTTWIIEYFDTDETLTGTHQQPKLAIILLPCTITNPAGTATAGYTIATTSAATTVADFNLVLTVWLESARTYSAHQLKQESLAAANFI